jgi:hypothetical protein
MTVSKEVAALRAMLREVQWVEPIANRVRTFVCAWCGDQEHVHDDATCKLAKLLRVGDAA